MRYTRRRFLHRTLHAGAALAIGCGSARGDSDEIVESEDSLAGGELVRILRFEDENRVTYNDRWEYVSGGGLVALDTGTGEVVWTFSSESLEQRRGAFALTPAVDGDRVFYGGRDGRLYALSTATGDEIWVTELGGFVSTPTRLVDSQLYVGTYSNELIRLDPDSGEITARLSTERSPHHALVPAEAPGGKCLIVLLGRPEVTCVDTDLEGIRWSRSTDEEWTSYNPLVIGGVVVLGSAAGELVAVRVEDGSTAWSTELDGMLRGLGVSGGILYVGTLAGTIYALELAP